MNITCPLCDTSIEVSKFLVGQKGRCPRCSSKFLIPENPDDEMELLETGEIPADEPEPEPEPEPKPKPASAHSKGGPPTEHILSSGGSKSKSPAAPASGARVIVPATGGGGVSRMPARPMVVKQSSGAFGFIFGIVLAALVGVVVYVMMERNKGPKVVEKKKEPEKIVVKVERKRPPVQPVEEEVEEPEVERIAVYEKIIQPLLEAKCVSCHGAEKAKGRLAMHTHELLMAGGGNGSIIEPDADDETRIEMIFRAELPEDDDEHMPPQGKPQLTAQELEILKWWIKAGAHEGLESDEAPEELQQTISELAKA